MSAFAFARNKKLYKRAAHHHNECPTESCIEGKYLWVCSWKLNHRIEAKLNIEDEKAGEKSSIDNQWRWKDITDIKLLNPLLWTHSKQKDFEWLWNRAAPKLGRAVSKGQSRLADLLADPPKSWWNLSFYFFHLKATMSVWHNIWHQSVDNAKLCQTVDSRVERERYMSDLFVAETKCTRVAYMATTFSHLPTCISWRCFIPGLMSAGALQDKSVRSCWDSSPPSHPFTLSILLSL